MFLNFVVLENIDLKDMLISIFLPPDFCLKMLVEKEVNFFVLLSKHLIEVPCHSQDIKKICEASQSESQVECHCSSDTAGRPIRKPVR